MSVERALLVAAYAVTAIALFATVAASIRFRCELRRDNTLRVVPAGVRAAALAVVVAAGSLGLLFANGVVVLLLGGIGAWWYIAEAAAVSVAATVAAVAVRRAVPEFRGFFAGRGWLRDLNVRASSGGAS